MVPTLEVVRSQGLDLSLKPVLQPQVREFTFHVCYDFLVVIIRRANISFVNDATEN